MPSSKLISSRTAFSLLFARGLNVYDAHDILADNGFDPHENAKLTFLTVGELAALTESWFIEVETRAA